MTVICFNTFSVWLLWLWLLSSFPSLTRFIIQFWKNTFLFSQNKYHLLYFFYWISWWNMCISIPFWWVQVCGSERNLGFYFSWINKWASVGSGIFDRQFALLLLRNWWIKHRHKLIQTFLNHLHSQLHFWKFPTFSLDFEFNFPFVPIHTKLMYQKHII